MLDPGAVYRVDSSPTLGVPVLEAGARLLPRPPWYRRWLTALTHAWQVLRLLSHV